jgi:hypothetical protein
MMHDDFSFESDRPPVAGLDGSMAPKVPPVIRPIEACKEIYNLDDSFNFQDSSCTPRNLPRKAATNKGQRGVRPLMPPQSGIKSKAYDIDALFSPISQMNWKVSFLSEDSPVKSLNKSTRPVAVHADVLYTQKARVDAKIEKLREAQDKQEMAQCSFVPCINPQNKPKRSFDSFLREQQTKVQERNDKVLKLKAKVTAQRVDKETTFKPQICQKSAKLAGRRSLPAYVSLHSASKSALGRSIKLHLKEASSINQSSRQFTPRVSKSPQRTSSKPDPSSSLRAKNSQARGAQKRPQSKSDRVLVDKLTREFNEALDLLVEGSAVNYLQVSTVLQKLHFLSSDPPEAKEQLEREQLIAVWHELDVEESGEVSKDKTLELLLGIMNSQTKAAKTYHLLHHNRRDSKRLKPNCKPKVVSAVQQSKAHERKLSSKLAEEGEKWKQHRQDLQQLKATEDLREATFKPRVNPLRKRTYESLGIEPSLSRTDLLFQMSKELNTLRDSKVKSHQQKVEKTEVEECLQSPDLSLSKRHLKLSVIHVAGEDKAVRRLREAQEGNEWKKQAIEKGLANLRRSQSPVVRDSEDSSSEASAALEEALSPTRRSAVQQSEYLSPLKLSKPASLTSKQIIVKSPRNTEFLKPDPRRPLVRTPDKEASNAKSCEGLFVEEPILEITVNFNSDESAQLVVYSEEDLEEAVEDFVRKHNLHEDNHLTLTQMARDFFDNLGLSENSSHLENVSEVSAEHLVSPSEGREAGFYESEGSEIISPRLDFVEEAAEESDEAYNQFIGIASPQNSGNRSPLHIFNETFKGDRSSISTALSSEVERHSLEEAGSYIRKSFPSQSTGSFIKERKLFEEAYTPVEQSTAFEMGSDLQNPVSCEPPTAQAFSLELGAPLCPALGAKRTAEANEADESGVEKSQARFTEESKEGTETSEPSDQTSIEKSIRNGSEDPS